jgi:preprotein translocase subunit SecD
MRKSGSLSLIVIVLIALGSLTYTVTKGGRTPQLGLDLQGGTSVVLAPKAGQPVASASLDQAISIIRRRVDGLGVAEPEITRQGNFIVVSLPGVKDQQRAIDLVGRTAKLQFRPVCRTQVPLYQPDPVYDDILNPAGTIGASIAGCLQGSATATTNPATATTSPSATNATATTVPPATTTAPAGSTTSGSSLGAGRSAGHLSLTQTPTTAAPTTAAPTDASSTTAPADSGSTTTVPGQTTTTQPPNEFACGKAGEAAADTPNDKPIIAVEDRDKNGTPDFCDVLGPVALEGSAVSSAAAAIPQGQWLVDLTLKDSGLTQWNAVNARCFDGDATCPTKQVGIVLDGQVQSAPVPQTREFTSNQIQISGTFTQKQADDLALVLNYGSLPIELEQQRVETVSATLGRDSLRAGLIAGMVGIAAVALYMILYYRMLGLVVVSGLMVWSALNYSIIVYLSSSAGLALSLAGVTGIVVSVGVTTDSYIVYFERMKDEIKGGKTVRSSVDYAFKKAWHTIVAADVASLIGAGLLFWLTVGAVRGFAFFLGLSTMLDLVTAYYFKRPMVALLARSRFLTEARWIGVAKGLGVEEHVKPSPAVTGAGR